MFISPLDTKTFVIMSTIKENKKNSVTPLPYNHVYDDATQAANTKPQVVYDEPYNPWINDIISQFGIPEDGIFNPYDYISQKNYKMNRRGMASYNEDLARLTYLADLRQQQFQNEYNSPENQAKLLREAGINPDLQGVSASGSSPGPTAQGSAFANTPTNMQQATNVLGVISNVASLTIDMLQGGVGISNSFLQNASSGLSLMGNVIDFMSRHYVNGINAHNLPLPRRAMRQLGTLRGVDGVDWFKFLNTQRATKENKLMSDLFDSNYSRFSKEFNKYYNAAENFDMDEWSKVWRPLSDFAEKIMLGEFKLKDKTTNNNLDYHNTKSPDGRSIGSMKGFSDVESYNQSSFGASIREPLRQVVRNLKKESDDGQSWANFALIALYLVTNMYGLK